MDEREMFEAWWNREMNVEEMDLHRCDYPMMPAHKQPYACHETNRAWMTWQAARRTTPDRKAIIDELCLALWDVRRLTGELSSDQIWTIGEHFRKLKTASIAAGESNAES